jgi:MoCo/4Fe-4S cofactor protein with predicted Tat translocation signal
MSSKNDSSSNLISASQIKPATPELDAVRQKLADAKGPKYWRTLEELADQEAFGELLEREFPRQASEWVDPVTRRNFLKLAGASMALAGLAGCTRQPLEQILPYVRQPENFIPGRPVFYATAMPFHGHALPLVVETHEFRPTKVEGNVDHPASMGATDLFAQASILNLYDPDRSTTLTHMGELKTWGEFVLMLQAEAKARKALQGQGLRFLTGAASSPTMGAQMKAIQQAYPQSKWHRWDPVNRDNVRAGSKMAFGAYYDAVYKFESAAVVVSLDADFLSGSWFPGFVRYARDFMRGRKLDKSKEMNRLYVAESSPTTTGAKADHKLVLNPSEMEIVARALAARLNVGSPVGHLSKAQEVWIEAVATDLNDHKGKCLVVPGEFQSPAVHALAHAINDKLGNIGQTVSYIDPVEADAVEHGQSIRELVADMKAGKVETLVLIGGNPVYNAPADLDFAAALEKVKLCIQLSNYKNETTDYMHWHVPETHYLEAWSDARAYDGTATIMQPLIAPLYDGRSPHEVLAIFNDQPGSSSHEIVETYWKSQHPTTDFEGWWRKTLHDGFVKDSASPARQVSAKAAGLPAYTAPENKGMEISFRPDPTIYDGSFINNGWLQETPKPLTRTTWDNVAMISPATAKAWGLYQLSNDNDHQSDAQRVLEVEFQGRKVDVPYWPQPGHPDNAITLFLGYGRKKAGRVGDGTGYDAYKVRPSAALYTGAGVRVNVTDRYWSLAVTQGHFTMDEREPVKVATLEEFLKNGNFAHEHKDEEPQDKGDNQESLYPNFKTKEDWYRNYAWGMSIDLNSCVGCQACAVACQSENNIAVVGKSQVQRGREMQWIRIDTYYEGQDAANPNVYFQPVPCMQCENAPCEPVCPVGATVHSTEGLNDMTYNRCVGTRYCSNNCPYKVRRFNFFLYSDFDSPSLKLGRNPDVSVRSRGVMEKCTYCVQRITQARIASEKEEREIRDGEIKTACQQVCPTEAITFGNLNDENSKAARLRNNKRTYQLLAELNTRPRTTYVAAVRNPNPKLASGTEKA